jgi:hypothetical protein
MRRYVSRLTLLPPPPHVCIIQKKYYYNARPDGVAISPPQARNQKNFYLGKPESPFKLRQVPEEEPSQHSDNYGKPCISDTSRNLQKASSITYSLTAHVLMTSERRTPLQLSPPLSLRFMPCRQRPSRTSPAVLVLRHLSAASYAPMSGWNKPQRHHMMNE